MSIISKIYVLYILLYFDLILIISANLINHKSHHKHSKEENEILFSQICSKTQLQYFQLLSDYAGDHYPSSQKWLIEKKLSNIDYDLLNITNIRHFLPKSYIDYNNWYCNQLFRQLLSNNLREDHIFESKQGI